MVKKLLNLFNSETVGVHNAAFLLGGCAFLSQIIALIRDRLLASTFGAGIELDLYYAAFKLSDIVFVTIASLVSVSVLVPFLVKRESDRKTERKFLDSIFSFYFYSIITVSVMLYVYTPNITAILFPGFSSEEMMVLVELTRIILLSPILLGISNIFGSIIQTKNQFFLFALSPVFYNIGIVIGLLFLVPIIGLSGLTWGVIIGAFMHMLIRIPGVMEDNLLPRLTFHIDWPVVKKVLFLSLPRTFTLATQQITLIVFVAIATIMSVGSVAVFNLSFNLQSVPLSIVGVSYSLAAFPTLSRLYEGKKFKEFITHITVALRHIIFWSIPISIYFIVLRAQIIRVILGSGDFSWDDTRLVAASLALFAISVVAQGAVLLFVRAFYAAGRTRLPLVANTVAMIVSVVLGFALYKSYHMFPVAQVFLEDLLRISGIPGGEVIVLALAFSVGTFMNLAVLWIMFERVIGGITQSISRTTMHALTAGVVGGFVSYGVLNILAPLVNMDTLLGVFLQGFVAGVIGIGFNMLILYLFKNEELREVFATTKRKIWKTAVVADSEVV